MPKMHGERQQDYQARMAFAIQSRVATAAKQAEYELMRRNGVAIPQIAIPVPCRCSLVGFPHFHSKAERTRFEKRLAPGSNAEAQMVRHWSEEPWQS